MEYAECPRVSEAYAIQEMDFEIFKSQVLMLSSEKQTRPDCKITFQMQFE